MKKEKKLWILTNTWGKILYTAARKECLNNYRSMHTGPTFKILLKGKYLKGMK